MEWFDKSMEVGKLCVHSDSELYSELYTAAKGLFLETPILSYLLNLFVTFKV